MVPLTKESKVKFQVHLKEIACLHVQLKIQLALLLIPTEQELWFGEKGFLFPKEFQQHHLSKLVNHEQVRILALMVCKILYW